MTKQEKNEALRKIEYASSMDDLLEFASELRTKWPAGRMADGHTPYRCSKKELADTLLRFHFHFGYDYTKEEISEACDRYLRQTENDRFRRCVKYFVIKELIAGEPTSDLATLIDNIRDGEEERPTDWKTTLV